MVSRIESENAGIGGHTASELLGLRAYRISDVCAMTQLGRTSVYAAIKSGELVARKWGRCTVVLAEDLDAFLRSLPTTK
jgi:Helix-turn-helix domain